MDNQERIKLLDKHNLCHKCEKARQLPNRKFCAECLEKIAQENADRYSPEKAHEYQNRRREIYREKKAKGICVRCTKPATHGMYCYECSIKAKKRNNINAQRRKRERHERGLVPQYRIANKLCWYCGKAIEDNKHGYACAECAKVMSEHGKKGSYTWKQQIDLFYRQIEMNRREKK